jgi:GNAT superfamily N-acetyltransferase
MDHTGEPKQLGQDELAHNVALSHAIGWPDVEGDWRVIHEAGVVVGEYRDGRLVGQGALGLYEGAGTIAKMVVAPDCQRQGIGRRILDRLMTEAAQREIAVLGLVATPAGRPLYESLAFEPAGDVVVYTGTPEIRLSPGQAAPLPDIDDAIRLDRLWLGCSRGAMLRGRWREAIATSSLTGSDGRITAYALATAQGTLSAIGPVVAERDDDACQMVRDVCLSVPGPVRIDVPAEQTAFRQWLSRVGMRETRVQTEFVRGAARLPWQAPQRYALASLAWG